MDRTTIYRMLADGRLAGFKVGGQWRFSRADIERWLQGQRSAMGSGAEELSPIAADLQSGTLPLPCTQIIQDMLAEALGLGALTTTPEGDPLTRVSNPSVFCALLLSSPAGRQRCVESWRTLGRTDDAARTGCCHAGLTYAIGRVTVQNELAAHVLIGQFLADDRLVDMESLAAACGVEAAQLRAAAATIPTLDRVRMEQVLRMRDRLAATFAEMGEERLNLLTRLRRIAELTAA